MQNRELKEFLGRFPEAFKITVNGADFSIKGDFALNGAELGGVINLVSSNTAAGETGVPIKMHPADKKTSAKFKDLRGDMLSDIKTGMSRADFMEKYGASNNTFIRYRAKACAAAPSKTAVKERVKYNAGRKPEGGHISEVKRNREDIIADIAAGAPKEKVMQKYGIGIATYNRRRREAESGTGLSGNETPEAGPSDHACGNLVNDVKRIFTEEKRKSIAKELLSVSDRTEKDAIEIADKYGINYKTVYLWAKKYASVIGMPYIKNSGGSGFKKRIHDQATRKEKIIAAVNSGKSKDEAESEIGHISNRSWYRYIRESKIAKGESVTKSNRRAVRLNRNEIMGDISAGMPDKEILKKWGISRETLRRHKIRIYGKSSGNTGGQIVAGGAVPETFGDGYIEKAVKEHAALKSFRKSVGSSEDLDDGCRAGHIRFIRNNKEKIIADLVNGMSKKGCLSKWRISERLYDDLKSIAVAKCSDEPEKSLPPLVISKSRLERSKSIIDELNRAENKVYEETGDYNFMLVKKNSNQGNSRNP